MTCEHLSPPLTASIDNTVTGRWRITTEFSMYEVDLDARTIVRCTDGVRMRRDGEILGLLRIVKCRVGESAQFLVGVRRDGYMTSRTTGHVLRIDHAGSVWVHPRAGVI